LSISLAEPVAPHRLCATLIQRIFAGAMGTCVLDWQGQTLKLVARDRDLADVPEPGPGGVRVWLSWPEAAARPLVTETR
jgi:hypothetical protein